MFLTDFRFVVIINGTPIGAFTECVLPTVEWEMQKISEGGLNHYVHQIPTRRKESTLTLKRGLGIGRELIDWVAPAGEQAESSHPMIGWQTVAKTITIELYNVQHKVAMSWTVERAFPMKWTAPSLKADGKAVAIESLELSCGPISITVHDIPVSSETWELPAPPPAPPLPPLAPSLPPLAPSLPPPAPPLPPASGSQSSSTTPKPTTKP